LWVFLLGGFFRCVPLWGGWWGKVVTGRRCVPSCRELDMVKLGFVYGVKSDEGGRGMLGDGRSI